MTIASTDIKFYASQGGLGGAIDESAEITTAGGGFDMENVSYADFLSLRDAASPFTYYKFLCVFVKNTHATETAETVQVTLDPGNPVGAVLLPDYLSLGVNGKNVPEVTIANANTTPAGATFTWIENSFDFITLPDLAPGDYHPIWIRRTFLSQQTNSFYANMDTRAETVATLKVSFETLL